MKIIPSNPVMQGCYQHSKEPRLAGVCTPYPRIIVPFNVAATLAALLKLLQLTLQNFLL